MILRNLLVVRRKLSYQFHVMVVLYLQLNETLRTEEESPPCIEALKVAEAQFTTFKTKAVVETQLVSAANQMADSYQPASPFATQPVLFNSVDEYFDQLAVQPTEKGLHHWQTGGGIGREKVPLRHLEGCVFLHERLRKKARCSLTGGVRGAPRRNSRLRAQNLQPIPGRLLDNREGCLH